MKLDNITRGVIWLPTYLILISVLSKLGMILAIIVFWLALMVLQLIYRKIFPLEFSSIFINWKKFLIVFCVQVVVVLGALNVNF
jgi:hypothetical protein